MMPGYSDVYVLAPERSASLVARFLDTFAPKREFSADEFSVHDAGRELSFTSCDAAVEFCSASCHASTTLYWRSLSPPPDHVMVFFLADGHLVLGVSTTEQEAIPALARLQQFCGPRSCGYITFEEPPPDNASAFRDRCYSTRDTKARIAAFVVLLYALSFFWISISLERAGKGLSAMYMILAVLFFVLPSVGLFFRANWCRILLGLYYGALFAFVLTTPLTFQKFSFTAYYPVSIVVTGLPVFLLFFYAPLKEFTRSRKVSKHTPRV